VTNLTVLPSSPFWTSPSLSPFNRKVSFLVFCEDLSSSLSPHLRWVVSHHRLVSQLHSCWDLISFCLFPSLSWSLK
jgi:hypothetical protein